MKLAYISTPYDSGNPFIPGHSGDFITASLEKTGAEIEKIPVPSDKLKYLFSFVKLYHRFLSGRNFLLQREPLLLKSSARQNERSLARSEASALIAFGTLPFTFLKDHRHKFVISDSTFAVLDKARYYFGRLAARSGKNGHYLERQALSEITHIFISSRWAYESLVNDYKVPKERITQIPLGPNLRDSAESSEIDGLVERRLAKNRIRLLFVGNNWKKKNGDKALNVFRAIRAAGADAELILVGSDIPPSGEQGIRVIGPLRKSDPAECAILTELYRSSSFFFLMSNAEAFGHVFAEASSFALPSIASDVHGIPDAVHEGKNGLLFSLATPDETIAEKIISLHKDTAAYGRLCHSSYAEFEGRLKWEKAAEVIFDVISSYQKER